MVVITIFGTFIFLNLQAILHGQNDCGCFGSVKVSPWYTFSLNIGMIGLLLWFRPRFRRLSVTVAALISSLIGVGALVAAGDTGTKLLARWRNESLLLQPAVLDFGEGVAGQHSHKQIVVANLTDHPIRLIGGTSGCSCTATEGLPVEVPANGQVTLDIHLEFKGTEGNFSHQFEYLTSTNRQPKLMGRLVGRVVANLP